MNEFWTSLVTDLSVFCAATTFAAGLVVAQRKLVANVARRFTRLPRFEQTLLVVAVCVMTVCAQKSGTNGVSNAEIGASNAEGDVFNAEIGGTQRRGEEAGQNGSYPPAKQPEGAARRGAESMTPPRNEEEISSVGRVIDATLPQANLDVTSSLTNLSSVSPNFSNLRVSPKASVTTNAIARGYAFVEARTNATVAYAMPTNGVVVGTWGKTGAYQDVVRVCLSTDCTDYHGLEEANATFSAEEGDLRTETRSSSDSSENSNASVLRAKKAGAAVAFPQGDACITSLWAHTWGKVRPRIRDRVHEIVAVGTPMSCVPGEGRLWTAATTNGSCLITWESFREGRRAKNISAQIELFPNGDFITRSNDVEHVYRRVNPDDWDDDGLANEIDDDNRAADICWPVKISVVGQNASNAANAVALASDVASVNASVGASATTASFTMSVDPACLDGVFAWTNVCCSISGSGSSFSYSCRSSCPCTGCSSSGYYVYEGYRVSCAGGTCGCLPSGGPSQESEPASVSVSFSKNAIIFEDEYEASDGVMVARRSTETVLSCSASGGGRGGFLYVSLEGADKLALCGGQSLPYSKALAANETISFTCRYRAVKASAAEGDIKVTATFAENETGTKQSAEATATAVRVRITPEIEAPENDCVGRHMYGIREEVRCRYFPSSAPVSWRVKSGCRMDGEILTCSLDAMENPLSTLCGDAVYTPNVSIVEPSGVECRDVVAETYGVPVNHAGGVGMRFELYVLPLTVSFERIAVEEVPCPEGTHTGYFAYSRFSGVWSHTEANGAGNWIDIQTGNLFGIDRPAITEELSRITDDGLLVDDDSYGWEDGELVWPIPLGWNDKGTTRGMKEYKRFATDVTHVTEIFENGRSGVRKLGNQVYRDIDGTVNLNGRIVHED